MGFEWELLRSKKAGFWGCFGCILRQIGRIGEEAREGGADVTGRVCDNGEGVYGEAFPVVADELGGLIYPLQGLKTRNGLCRCAGGFCNKGKDIGDGNGKLAFVGMAGNFVVVMFNDMGQSGNGEVIVLPPALFFVFSGEQMKMVQG